MIDQLKSWKGKTKLNFYKFISSYYDEMSIRNFKLEEDPPSKNVEGISKIYHEVFFLMKFLQAKPQIKNMNIKYYDLNFTVIKHEDD